MCSVAGFYNAHIDFLNQPEHYYAILEDMNRTLYHRGPDDKGVHLSSHFGLAHTRLSIIDLVSGHQPMLYKKNDRSVGIVYNGELYNLFELKTELENLGYSFSTTSDTEVILLCYVEYGVSFIKKLNGIFSIAIMDENDNCLYLFRDRLGVKPLFYSLTDDSTLVFASEIKGLFAHPDIHPQITEEGFNEIFSLGPAKTPGKGVFHNVCEVLPGHYIQLKGELLLSIPYWKLYAACHTDSYEDTLEHTHYLVTDAIKRQMISDVPIATFLSGGVDSSIVSAVCAKELAEKGEILNTFSFDFEGNDDYFQANSFQPSRDRPFVDIMVEDIKSNHRYLECDNQNLIELLYTSVLAHDLPAMADVDSSMLYFCSLVKDYNKVVLTGECADEIFGGYPWFHKEEFFQNSTFPWMPNPAFRKEFLKEDFCEALNMEDYIRDAYETSISMVPTLESDSPCEKRRREISYLNLRWFMQTLLDRMDRSSMYWGLEARVPFADHRIVEYLYNVPWEMKTKDGEVKSLLRNSCQGLLPDSILFRKKSPYPKTYHPEYEAKLAAMVKEIVLDTKAPLYPFIHKEKLLAFMAAPSDYGKPWYGQLMAGPQMLAYLLQTNFWLEHYQIQVLSK